MHHEQLTISPELPIEYLSNLPDDKSWDIKLGLLDLSIGSYATLLRLEDQVRRGVLLSDDQVALGRASQDYFDGKPIRVGESGTLFRSMRALCWTNGQMDREFIIEGTLSTREVCNDPEIITWDNEALLTLDNGTSQWASALFLLRPYTQTNRIDFMSPETPYKLRVAGDAKLHWLMALLEHRPCQSRKDSTLIKQAASYVDWVANGANAAFNFYPEQAEDAPLAIAFEIITPTEAGERWPALAEHESNRLVSVTEAIDQYEAGEKITSRDHRVIQALAMRFHLGPEAFMYPESVNKSWPTFWYFMSQVHMNSVRSL